MITITAYAKLMAVSHMTVRRWIKNGMPCVKIGSIIRIDPEKALEWLNRGT